MDFHFFHVKAKRTEQGNLQVQLQTNPGKQTISPSQHVIRARRSKHVVRKKTSINHWHKTFFIVKREVRENKEPRMISILVKLCSLPNWECVFGLWFLKNWRTNFTENCIPMKHVLFLCICASILILRSHNWENEPLLNWPQHYNMIIREQRTQT